MATKAELVAAGKMVQNPFQLGGIETSVLDNGPGRGNRIAWINTGSGLRYKVVIDRGLDIADAEYNGQSLTWHSLTGITRPNFAYHLGLDWLYGFYGGMLVGCGPTNAGGPCEDAGEQLGLHGLHSHLRATVESIINPDPKRGVFEMSITGIVRCAKVFGPDLELRRTISSPLGEPVIRVHDEFVNRGNATSPHAWLLHINFGYPLLEPGSRYCYEGTVTPRPDPASEAYFAKGDCRKAPPPLKEHRGAGEACCYVDIKADRNGAAACGVVNSKRKVGVRIDYNKKQYPKLVNWQHWGPEGAYVGALEPMNCTVQGRDHDRKTGVMDKLRPNETRCYDVQISVVTDRGGLQELLAMGKP